ncbi:MAG: hypothetical protein SVW77_00755 [Candidatus Nanohaloarchaea archaeon]|nr:hypothetical protein [Candidatus Nanohaloarchaea archaeon]
MVKEFLRRRLNPFLLVSTVVVLAILAGLSVTYQDVLSEKVSTNQQLRQTVEEKNVRIATLENRTANLSTRLAAARQDLAATVNETQRQEQLITDLESAVTSLNSTVQSLRSTVASQEATIADLESEVETQESEIVALKDNLTLICEDVPASNMTDAAADACERWED